MTLPLRFEKRSRDLGGGFQVGRLLPHAKQRMVGPFAFFDHMGPLELAPGIPRDLDVKPHPHIGLSTVTYLYNGALTHRDSLGYTQEILPGEVNWMVAGSGITHSERLEYARAHGASLHGIQAWVALPREDEETDPAFYHYGAGELPEFDEDNVSGRLITGSIDGISADVKTHSPMFYMHWDMLAGARRSLSAEYSERAIYVATGAIQVGDETLTGGDMIILPPGKRIQITAHQPATIMLLGGEPVGERFIHWNFVSSSKERIEQARADWLAQRMKLPDGDDQEFVPLPR